MRNDVETLENEEERALWRGAVNAVLATERCGWDVAVNTGDIIVRQYRERLPAPKPTNEVDTQV